MNPQVGSSETDAVWVYTLTYGGGIVSGDSISCEITVADACTAVLTTQASTKVYKSLGSKSSEQILEMAVPAIVEERGVASFFDQQKEKKKKRKKAAR
ncbi:hypothetical protein CISIN_1g034360mg [Citrus sinensis]|uniref:Urease accessory protein UreD n=1 Tax=Citrus sinensis TaxID=2711 RepID=A0A067D1G0_CITSI|nr:hypothetical protein CISIN_1g034360mg [Citrus sinensis]